MENIHATDRRWQFTGNNLTVTYIRQTAPCPDDYYMHAHDFFEVLFFLSGSATHVVQNTEYTLKPYDAVFLRPFEAHRVVLKDAEVPYERIVVIFYANAMKNEELRASLLRMFYDRELGKSNLYAASDYTRGGFPFDAGTDELIRQLGEDAEAYVQAKWEAYLADTLVPFKARDHRYSPDDAKIAEVLEYINTHLTESLTVDRICENCFLSRAQLGRLFRRSIGTSVWQYVLVQRLLVARSYIRDGESPTDVYERCGFGDYSSFYRAYCSHFGNPPARDKPGNRREGEKMSRFAISTMKNP